LRPQIGSVDRVPFCYAAAPIVNKINRERQ
jgi:hypothetical protein